MKKTVFVALFGLALTVATSAHADDKLKLILDWYVNPDHGPIIVADKLGYFKDAGLDVEIVAPADATPRCRTRARRPSARRPPARPRAATPGSAWCGPRVGTRHGPHVAQASQPTLTRAGRPRLDRAAIGRPRPCPSRRRSARSAVGRSPSGRRTAGRIRRSARSGCVRPWCTAPIRRPRCRCRRRRAWGGSHRPW